MALTVVRYGRYTNGSPDAATGIVSAGASRASVYDPLSDNVWITTAGAIVGKVGSNVSLRISVYDTDSSKNPRTRQGYFAPVTVSAVMVGGGDGTEYTAAVSGSDTGPTNDAIMLVSGRRYAIDLLAGSNAMRHSMIDAGSIAADNEQFYDRAAPSNPPPTSYGSYSASVEGWITAYLEGYKNEAPIAPNNRVPNGTINETAPTFTATFRDLNGAYGDSSGDGVDTGDRCSRYQIQLRAVASPGTLLWDSTADATGTEKSTDSLSRAYSGSTLTRGTAYEWRIRTADQFNAWGDWSSWLQFTPANLGFVTLDSTPTGKILSVQPDFKGRWTHQSGTSMKRVRVQIRAADGITVLQTGADYDIADVLSSTSPGTLFTVPWANTGLSTLAWGTNYTYAIQGYDGTVWSDYSAPRSFTTDAAPSIPSGLAPSGGTIFTSFPKLSFSMSDADDTSAGTLAATVRITKPDTSTVDVAATYNGTSGKWEFQTTGTQLSAYGTYSWMASGYDGTLYSGETTSSGSRVWSSPATFDYKTGPTVTMVSPTDGATVASASLPVSWTTTDQQKYRVQLFPDGSATAVYDTGTVTSTTSNHTIPSGYYRNGQDYDLVVTVTDSTPLSGASDIVNITVDYTPPDPPANFQVTPVAITTDPTETAVRLSWDQTELTAPEFVEYTIYRAASGGPDAAEIILARLTSPSDTALIDYTPASGYEYTYSARVVTITGLDELESEAVEGTATLDLQATVLTLVGNGGTHRAVLTNVRERSDTQTIDEAVYQPLGRSEPTTVRGRAAYYVATVAGFLISTDDATAAQRKAEFEALIAQSGTVCMRYGDGTKRFVKLSGVKIDWVASGLYYAVSFTARTERYTEGTA